jgi:membrane dipeptidase
MVTFVGSFVSHAMNVWSASADSVRAAVAAGGDTTNAGARAAVNAWRRAHPRPQPTIADVADHIEHVRDVAGIDHVGLGGDFDGTTGLPKGLDDVSGYPNLFAELIRRGWTDADLLKLAGGNILRVLGEVEQVRDRLAA